MRRGLEGGRGGGVCERKGSRPCWLRDKTDRETTEANVEVKELAVTAAVACNKHPDQQVSDHLQPWPNWYGACGIQSVQSFPVFTVYGQGAPCLLLAVLGRRKCCCNGLRPCRCKCCSIGLACGYHLPAVSYTKTHNEHHRLRSSSLRSQHSATCSSTQSTKVSM